MMRMEDDAVVARKSMRVAWLWAARAGVAIGVIVLWQLASGRWVNPLFLPQPTDIVNTLVNWLTPGSGEVVWGAILTTIRHAITGLAVGCVLGVVVALVVWRTKTLGAVIEPYVAVANNMPRITLLPLFILWVGSGEATLTVYVVTTVFFTMFYNGLQGFRSSDAQTVGMLRIMGSGRWEEFRWYVAPHAREYLLAGVLIAVPQSMLSSVVGEMILGGGLGGLLTLSRNQFDAPALYAATLLAAVLGVVLNSLVVSVRDRARASGADAMGL